MAARAIPNSPKDLNINSKPDMPQYWHMLNEEEKLEFKNMQNDFINGSAKKTRNNRTDSFEYILDRIKKFTERGDNRDWERYLVCGVCWLDNAIAINTRQLRILVSKCKSSINGSLQKMGFSTNTSHSESWKILFPKIPFLKEHFNELRQWTIRFKNALPSKSSIGEMSKPPIPQGTFIQRPQLNEMPIRPASPVDLVNGNNERNIHTPCWPLKFRSKMVKVHNTA